MDDQDDIDSCYRDEDEYMHFLYVNKKRALIEKVIILELEQSIQDMIILRKIIGNNVRDKIDLKEWVIEMFEKAIEEHFKKGEGNE